MTSPRESGWTIINMKEEALDATPDTRGIFPRFEHSNRQVWHYGSPGEGIPLYDDLRRYIEAKTGRVTGLIGRTERQRLGAAKRRQED